MENLTSLIDDQTQNRYQIISNLQFTKTSRDSVHLVTNFQGQKYVAKVGGSYLVDESQFLIDLNRDIPQYVPSLPGKPDKVLNFDVQLNKWFILMEYIPYSLLDLINNKNLKMNETQVKILARLLLNMFEQFHRLNIIHCDVKPGNILSRTDTINENTQLVLIDFGLSIYLNQEKPACVGGNLNYISTRYNSLKFSLITANIVNDLEAIGYILLAFILKIRNKKLPWSGIKDFHRIRSLKFDFQRLLLKSKIPIRHQLGLYFDLLSKYDYNQLDSSYYQSYDQLYEDLISLFKDDIIEEVTEIIPILPTFGNLKIE